MNPPKIFISYSRKDLNDIKLIVRTLMIHGIKTWQDINNLGAGLTEGKIRLAIRKECSGLTCYCTKTSVKSPIICKIELPEAENRHKNNSRFNIVPIFKLGTKETAKALRTYLTIPLSNFNGSILKNGKKEEILVASQKASEIILNNIKFDMGRPLPIGLVSKQKTTACVALDMDFTEYFATGFPSQEVWTDEFIPALECLKKVLLAKKITHVRLYSFAHLSFGFMMGYIFRQRTGFKLEIEQLFPTSGFHQIWSTHKRPTSNPLTIHDFPGEVRSKNLCIKINLMSKDNSAFSNYIKKRRLTYRALIEVAPRTYPCTISNGQAVTIASEIASTIKIMHAKYRTDKVHVFAAIPLGLAMLIGYHLNACGKIQCYEFDNISREYKPSCILT